jgi:uncharacterized protein YgiM (DUF1202 family)
MRRWVALLVLASACAAPPPPVAAPEPAPATTTSATPAETASGTVRVTASTLNVRAEPSPTAPAIAQVRKGERLALLATSDEWVKVRRDDGTVGWVAKQHVTSSSASSSAATPRARRGGCPADSNYSFTKTPVPTFSDSSAHGVVTVEANVSAKGEVQSTRVIANTTGDESLAVLAAREIAQARFAAPVRNCAAKAFIFTYKRSF